MGLRKIVTDNEGGIGLSLILFVLFPSFLTLGLYTYETTTGIPIIETEALPEILGYQIEWVWQIVAVVCIMIIVIYALSLLLKPKPRGR